MARPMWASLLLLVLAAAHGSSSIGDDLAFVQHSVATRVQGEADAATESVDEAELEEEEDEDEEEDEEEEEDTEEESEGVFLMNYRLTDEAVTQHSAFQVGDSAEINVARCLKGGAWASCKVTGTGSVPGTFDIHIPANPEGHKDVRNIPAKALRHDAETAFEGRVGEMAEVNVAKCLEGGSWSTCKITGLGSQAGTYNVEVADGDGRQGHQTLRDVPLKALRPKL
eukprot:CAMPEP_0171090972 /NCGR_PEP_ID=MMETSP0766_2-20121228/32165_1 /TAXON_ID=439317 /ORGANISM="Gambierdiscus australes, Strain CAWD 149" /LENGTH=225 /DNA_ID=CAMNT_0011549019 /DNA_START=55 /DNA_END=732 /DNA_ORIENTATION=+